MSSLGVRSWERIKLAANIKNHCFIATSGKINLFVQVGDLVPTLGKPELCIDVLIAE